ncbi:MAG: diaminopimelate epimerase [Vicinamibacterales bacterium]
MRFLKAHAYGNDFLYVAKEAARGRSPEALARALCDRHTGIGADGLILYERAADGASMQLFNADGSRAEVSGNGVRALGALLLRDVSRLEATLTIHTDAGPKRLERIGQDGSRQVFRTAMGLPRDVRQVTLSAAGEALPLVLMDFGNPQCVVLGPLPGTDRFERLGNVLAHHEMFSDGTNVEFADVEQPDSVRILIWERGVGPTASSGTGSCAALVAAAAFGGASREADVIAPGGTQHVAWRDDSVYLTGWAEVLADGEWLAARQIPRT